MKVRVVGKRTEYTTEAQVLSGTGDVVHFTEKGMFCKWKGTDENEYCEDYEVKFCC